MKWDESDFQFQMEYLPDPKPRPMRVEAGRLMDKPQRRRSILIRPGLSVTEPICFHSKLLTHPCALCRFEIPKLGL